MSVPKADSGTTFIRKTSSFDWDGSRSLVFLDVLIQIIRFCSESFFLKYSWNMMTNYQLIIIFQLFVPDLKGKAFQILRTATTLDRILRTGPWCAPFQQPEPSRADVSPMAGCGIVRKKRSCRVTKR